MDERYQGLALLCICGAWEYWLDSHSAGGHKGGFFAWIRIAAYNTENGLLKYKDFENLGEWQDFLECETE